MQGSGNPVWFVTPDLLDGPLHSNDQIHILGDPTFLGCVRSAYGGPDDHPNHVPSFEYYNGDYHNHIESDAPSNPPHDVPTFGSGYELGTSAIALPTSSMADFAAAAKDGGIFVKSSREVAFGREDAHGNSMHGYVSYRKNPRKPWTDVEISGTNGIMYVKGQVKLLGGTLDGRLTVASNSLMKIEDDIVYRASDENGPLPGCDDMLGLVCKGDIVVSDNAANQDGCVIHAHVVATHTSFKAEHWARRRPSGILTLYGGICQRFRGPVGTAYLDGDDLVILTGFRKDYHYDRRLLGISPPGYSHILNTGLYVSLGWREIDSS
jgi:hypothetical protein